MDKIMKYLCALLDWIDARFPLTKLWNEHLAKYYAPKNFNFWYFFGSLALLVLVIQIVTGIWLTMNYKPSAEDAFASVEYIMRDVEWGWWMRYMHSTGSSAFFIVIYLHMFRALLYGSFKKPRELLWLTGMFIYLTLMGEAFFGYLLPWGQMSYWGAQVIISLFGAIPVIGDSLALWIRGDYVVSDVTLNRFFSFHVIAMPLVLLGLVFVHILALHEVGSNNPDGVEIKKKKDEHGIPLDGIPFHPYYTVKDIVGVVVFLIFFSMVVFYNPEMGGYFLEHNNFIPADPLKTPEHIAPVWYFTPYYAILRAIPSQVAGVFAMGLAVMLFFFLPWLDRSPVKSIRYRGWKYRLALTAFTISFLALGWLGMQVAIPTYTWLARVFSVIYFMFFVFMPFYTSTDNDKPVPERVRYP
ncbi:MAG: Ubiquinol--cytochrome c reductase, cytochrome subunit [Gammaproteobacteria bacterium]|nr:Ubiquinol--cytochrome c reductase, cytochrome subunit [Gammaproteobacteria bacterium]